MKYFPLKTVIFCLLCTPILYIATLNFSQKYLNHHYFQKIERISIGETSPLLKGQITVEEHLSINVHTFLKADRMVQNMGLDLNVSITTQKGNLLYPVFIDEDAVKKKRPGNEEIEKTAKRNLDILNDGMIFRVEVNLNHGSNMANLILFAYFSCAIVIFLIFYKIGNSRAMHDRKAKTALIDDLQKEEQIRNQHLENLKNERSYLFKAIKSLNAKYLDDKKKLKINEEEMFDEIISLEAQLNSFIELKYKNDEEINQLKSKIKKYGRRKSSKGKRKEFDFIVKRFAVLYKDIEMNRKATSGFLALNHDQQIKAEELVLLLDQNPDQVTIKRKVFSGKKHKTACFEVLFAYNGRLYFKKNENNKVEILVIGTKNTQGKDMEFLHSV